ncbi:hypothetical protein [Sorangium cellulosum]|uniref:hypothetical protein n=1 Tax=Sorangium cellulosum TaxID=56 RepID=UPI0012FF8FC5|nr:hypothetical protein [Sorangium cellulosum]
MSEEPGIGQDGEVNFSAEVVGSHDGEVNFSAEAVSSHDGEVNFSMVTAVTRS